MDFEARIEDLHKIKREKIARKGAHMASEFEQIIEFNKVLRDEHKNGNNKKRKKILHNNFKRAKTTNFSK